MLTYPHFDPVALQLGPLRIHWYGIMYLVAFGAGWWLARRRAAQPLSTHPSWAPSTSRCPRSAWRSSAVRPPHAPAFAGI